MEGKRGRRGVARRAGGKDALAEIPAESLHISMLPPSDFGYKLFLKQAFKIRF